ncbi:MAG: NADH-quinone oxidoreductase subunit J [Trueperaceae bacterium]
MFAILAAMMVLGAIGVVTLRRPVRAALALVFTLVTLAIAFLQLHAPFLAATQVIVYAGAIMVLFLFVIMLLNVDGDPIREGDRLRWLGPFAWLIALVGLGGLVVTVLADVRPLPGPDAIAAVFAEGGAGGIGDVLYGRYLLAFQLVGVLLLTGIVAAVGLVQRKPTVAPDEQLRSGMPRRTPGAPPPADLPGGRARGESA